MQIYDMMFDCYGPQHWWPADESFEVIVGAILTQSTAWQNVEKAIASLKNADVLNPISIDDMPIEELAALIYPSGYFNAKAKKLKAFTQRLGERYGYSLDNIFAQDTGQLRLELLSIYGIGQETADSIILYAAQKPVFVIDAYTHRVMSRLELNQGKADYIRLQNLFMDNLDSDAELFNEYHALIVCHGKNVCRKIPLCSNCCLVELCLANQ